MSLAPTSSTNSFIADQLRHPSATGQQRELVFTVNLAEAAFLLGLLHYAVNDFNYETSDHLKTSRIAEIMTSYTMGVTVPIGAIVLMTVDYIPYGYLKCDGKPIPPEYSALRAMIGTHTPYIDNEYLRLGQYALDTGGSNSVTLSEANMPTHSHTFVAPQTGPVLIGEIPSVGYAGHFFGQTDTRGEGLPFSVEPRFITLIPLIKAL